MDICEIYKIKIINGKRYYEINMGEKYYGYEFDNTIPYIFKYCDEVIQSSKWNRLAIEIVTYLDSINPKPEEELLSLRYDFSKMPVFSKEKKTNFTPYKHLFLNTNHSSGHSFRSIQTILRFYGVNSSECYFLLRRHIDAEPTEVKTYFRNTTKASYKRYLSIKGYDGNRVNILIGNIDSLNKYLCKLSTSFNDFFLFDEYNYFISYKRKLMEYMNKHYKSNEKFLLSCETSLRHLDMFFKNRQIIELFNSLSNVDSFKRILKDEIALLFENLKANVISSYKVYSQMRLKHRENMIVLGKLNNKNDFFSICEILLSGKYKFERPFISKSSLIKLSNADLMMNYAYNQEKITVNGLSMYADKMHFKRIENIAEFFIDLSNQFVQISIDTLMNKDLLNLDEEIIDKIRIELSFYINNVSNIDTNYYCGYGALPILEQKWNKYLLAGIVRTYLFDDFDVENTKKPYNHTEFIIRLTSKQ